MGVLKEGLTANVKTSQEIGTEISNLAGIKLEDTTVASETLSSLECIDDEDRDNKENAKVEAKATAVNIASTEVREPTSKVVGDLNETSTQAQDYENIEINDSHKASDMVGDFSGIGSSLSSGFEASADDFGRIASDALDVASQIESTNDALATKIEGAI